MAFASVRNPGRDSVYVQIWEERVHRSNIAKQGTKTAKAVGLIYVSDEMPGFRRLGTKKVFRYLDTRGNVIRDSETLRRIERLAIPPAWTHVWICPSRDGHLQAVGRDAR